MEFRFPDGCLHQHWLSAFTRWDAAHFLSVAADGWDENIYSHAFFPAYPLLIRALANILAPVLTPALCISEVRVMVGVALSNVSFVIAACCLHALGNRVLHDPSVARIAAQIFCVAPASVFFSTVYSESMFAAATFGGLLLLEAGAPWAAALSLALASSCRANGVLNILPVVYLGACRLAQILDAPVGLRSPRLGSPLRSRWRQVATAGLHGFGTLLQVAVVLSPYIAWQIAGYRRVCLQSSRQKPLPSRSTPTRVAREAASGLPIGWCSARRLPDLYAFVQDAYWGVGVFRYYELRQLPNFALAAPNLVMWAATAFEISGRLWAHCRGEPLMELLRAALRLPTRTRDGKEKTKSSTSLGALAPRNAVYVMHWSVLTVLCFLCANVQVITRVVGAACPTVYWVLAHSMLRRGDGWLAGEAARAWTMGYVAAFVIVGTILHSNFFPWT